MHVGSETKTQKTQNQIHKNTDSDLKKQKYRDTQICRQMLSQISTMRERKTRKNTKSDTQTNRAR